MSHAQRPGMLPTVSGNWVALAVRGVAAVLFGLAALIWPGLTLAVLIILYGAYAVVDGVFAIVAGLRAGSGMSKWLLLAEGALGILAGRPVLSPFSGPALPRSFCSTSSLSGPSSAGS